MDLVTNNLAIFYRVTPRSRRGLESFEGLEDVGEISTTSAALPEVTRRWRSLDALTDEVANARIWAGSHYRFSPRVGTAMGRKVGRYVATHFAPSAR
jgi:hypothetical protein